MKMPDARSRALVIGSLADAVHAAERHATVAGWKVLASKRAVGGDTQEMAHTLASFVSRATAGAAVGGTEPGVRGLCLVSGGETTVRLGAGHKSGTGGRNQELALAVLAGLGEAGLRGACVLSGGTDGEDGPTDAAGAWVDAKVAAKARELKLDPADFLARHDSHPFFEKTGGLLKTGWTGTNVADLRVALVRRAGETS
jgi:glycerate-2-kinase